MSGRIRAVREALGLSQRKFGERLGVSRDVISNLEYGRVPPKELLLQHICQLYGVNETWLRTGEGEMFHSQHYNKNLEEAVKLFRSLCPEFQAYALEQLRSLVELQNKAGHGEA